MYLCICLCPRRQEKDAGFPETGLTGLVGHPDVCVREVNRSLTGAVPDPNHCPKHGDSSPAPPKNYNI